MINKYRVIPTIIFLIFSMLPGMIFSFPSVVASNETLLANSNFNVKVFFENYIPPVMVLGKTYTISVNMKNTFPTEANFTVILSADGEYFYINAYKAAIQPYYINFYGYYPVTIKSLKPGEESNLKFFLLPHRLYSSIEPLNITAIVVPSSSFLPTFIDSPYNMKIQTFVQRIETNVQVKDKITSGFWAVTLVMATIIVVFRRKVVYFKKDVLLFLGFFILSFLIRSTNVGNQSISYDEMIYLSLSEVAVTNGGGLTEVQLQQMPPLFIYLVITLFHLFGAQIEFLRFVSIFAGSLTVSIVYLIGKELFGEKTGFLSASLVCLSGYHILYSRILMQEATSIFTIMVFFYFFLKVYLKNAGSKYIILSGVSLGLAIMVKFTSLFLCIMMAFLVCISYWRDRRIESLFDKRIIAIVVICVIVMSPYLLHLYSIKCNPFYGHLVTRFKLQKFRPYEKLSLTFVQKAWVEYTILLTQGHRVLPWSLIFRLIALPLSFLAGIFHLNRAFQKQSNSLLIIVYLIAAFISILLFLSRHTYYLLYLLIPHYIIIADFIFHFIRESKSNFSKLNYLQMVALLQKVVKITIFTLVGIFVGSYILIGLTAPFVEKGGHDGLLRSVLYVKNHLDDTNTDESSLPMLLGFIEFNAAGGYGDSAYLTDYYLDIHGVDAKVMTFYRYIKRVGSEYRFIVDFEAILFLKPKFIIVSEYMYTVYFTPEVMLSLQEFYRIAMSTEPLDPDALAHFYVLERIP